MSSESVTELEYTPPLVVQKIALICDQRGLLPLHVGDKLGFARNRINRWITTSGVPDVYQIMLVAQLLDVDAVYLMFDSIPITDDPPKYRDLTKLVAPHESAAGANSAEHGVHGTAGTSPAGVSLMADYDLATINDAVNQLLMMTDALTDVMPEVLRFKKVARRAIEGI